MSIIKLGIKQLVKIKTLLVWENEEYDAPPEWHLPVGKIKDWVCMGTLVDNQIFRVTISARREPKVKEIEKLFRLTGCITF